MRSGKERTKWISASAHPKEGLRAYPGPSGNTADRDGRTTQVNRKPGLCVACREEVAAQAGWLIVLPFRAGPGGSTFAVMCRPCAAP